MNIILRTLIILVVGTFVAGALYLTVENTSLLSEAGGFPEGASELHDTGDMSEQPEGDHDHHAASLSSGLADIGVSLAKVTGITLVILLVQRIFTWLKRRLPGPSLQSI